MEDAEEQESRVSTVLQYSNTPTLHYSVYAVGARNSYEKDIDHG